VLVEADPAPHLLPWPLDHLDVSHAVHVHEASSAVELIPHQVRQRLVPEEVSDLARSLDLVVSGEHNDVACAEPVHHPVVRGNRSPEVGGA
jgi:hypothetical protein